MNVLEPICEAFRDARSQVADTEPGQCGDLNSFGKAIGEPAPAERVDHVDLVHDDLERKLVGADVVQDGAHRRLLLVEPLIRRRCVDDEQDEVCDERLLESGGEAFDQLRRQAPDEADSVGDEIAPAVVLEGAGGRIERLEEPVVDGDVSIGQRVEERRLADVRVPRQSDSRRFAALPLLPPHVALLAQIHQTSAQERDASPGDPSVGLELRLAGAARTDACPDRPHATAEALEMLPHSPHARQVVFELGEFDLELALGAPCVLGEDVEDQLCPVDDAGLQRVFERSLLRRVELVVDQQHFGPGLFVLALELVELPLAHVRSALRPRTMLDELPDGFDECRVRELSQLGQLGFRLDTLGQHGDDEPTLQRRVRLALDHERIMPPTGQNPTMTPVKLSPALIATGAYPFVKLEEAKRRLAARGVPLVDFGKGDPREPTDPMIREALVASLTEISTYPLAEGLPELRKAVAGWCGRRFGVELDASTEVVPTYGSKEAIFLLAQMLVDRDGDKRLVVTTEPGYPVPDRGAAFAGAAVLQLPLLEEHGFMPDLDAVGVRRLGASGDRLDQLPEQSDRRRRLASLSSNSWHDFRPSTASLLAADEAYTELWFDEPPHSALEVRRHGNVAVFNTLSKRSSMTGYRSGFVAADPDLIAALKQFRPSVGTAPQDFVQRASVVAWNDEAHVERTRAAYRRKRDALLPTLERKGIRVAGSEATMFLWLEVPGEEPADAFAGRLLEHGLIVSPGTFFGPAGEGYWRMALVPTEAECVRAAEILEEVL